jgi:hypothetical protein
MTLVRLEVRFRSLDALVEQANSSHVVASVVDADTVIALGSLHDQLKRPLGVWLDICDDYSAPLAARDVATLSWLVPLDTVVVASPAGESGADVVRALLTNDEVNFSNDVATIVAAYNRPAPPSPITVWSWDGTSLRHDDDVLHVASSAETDAGVVTTFR